MKMYAIVKKGDDRPFALFLDEDVARAMLKTSAVLMGLCEVVEMSGIYGSAGTEFAVIGPSYVRPVVPINPDDN